MNVCIITGTLPDLRCGIGDYTYRLCSGLKKHKGINLRIITSRHSAVKEIDGIEIRPVMEKWGFAQLGTLLRAVRETAPDLVHIQYPTQVYKYRVMINLFPLLFKAIFRNIPLVVTIHDVKTAHPLNKLRLVTFLFCADKIILTNRDEEGYLLARCPFLKRRVKAIDLGANVEAGACVPEAKGETRLRMGVEEGEVLISNFGYILPKKNIETILLSLRRLRDERYKVKFISISSFNPLRDRYHASLERLVKRLDLNQHVVWAGYCPQEEVSRYLFSSDICIQPYQDGVSFRRASFLTSSSHGLPIISTAVGDLPEGLKNRDNLLTVSPGNIDEMVTAVKELIHSSELRSRLGKNARVLFQRFSWERIANEHFALYRDFFEVE